MNLLQELVASADLLGITSPRGPLGSLEFIIENTFISAQNFENEASTAIATYQRTQPSLPDLITLIDSSEVLKNIIVHSINLQVNFFNSFRFSDKVIYSNSQLHIEDIYNKRKTNITKLAKYADDLDNGASVAATLIDARRF